MKKCTFFLLLFSLASYSQTITFADPNFKNALVNTLCVDTDNNYINDSDADSNNNGEIELSEALAVTKLDIQSQSISNLSGIEQFSNLTDLNCNSNPLVTLILTNFPNLTTLQCDNCQLTSLVLDNMSNLSFVYAGTNFFYSLDLSTTGFVDGIFGPNPNLEYLNLKNGHDSLCVMLLMGSNTCTIFDYCPALTNVCLDETEYPNFLYAPLLNPYTVLSTYCSTVPGGGYNSVVGNVTFDCGNQNINVANARINITNGAISGYTYTNISGNYSTYMGLGTHTITPQLENSTYFQFAPPTVDFTFSATGTTQTANFCLIPNGVHSDVEITILPLSNARPGFDSHYKIVYKNVGNQIHSGTISFDFDDAIFDVVTTSPTVLSQNGNTLNWMFSNLNPFESREIMITLNLNGPMETPAVNNGDLVYFSANATPDQNDETPENNTYQFNQIVIGSFDPNDKTCIEGDEIALADINKPLHYIVRFQNTGTAAAENVVIKDLLNSKLDWNSVQIISSSHPFRSTLTQGNNLEFFFENINLPASSVDEPGSNGYIAFSIKPKTTVVVDDVITNTASIYFDFNFPIITNTTATTVRLLSTTESELQQLFTVYPNPTRGILNIKLNENRVIDTIELYNSLGQLIKSTESNTSIDVQNLPAGTYFISVYSDKGKGTQKFIKL